MGEVSCKRVVRFVVLAAVAAMIVAAVGACGSATQTTTSNTPSAAVVRGGDLTLARFQEPLTFDPVGPSDNGSIYLIEQVFNTLVEPDQTGNGLVPGLAEKWDISPDGLEYTFHLRSAKFSNGDPVTSADVTFSLNREANPKVSPYAFLFTDVAKIQALDAMTVRVTLKEPNAAFLSSCSVFAANIVPKAVFEANPKAFGNKPVGSGPFMVAQYSRGNEVVLVRNPYYWQLGADGKPLPYLDKVTVKYVPESNSRILGLRDGTFDAIEGVPFNEGKSLTSTSGISLGVDSVFNLDYLYINHQKAPLNNKDFCLALNYATDRQAILRTVFFGYGQIPNSFMPKLNFWDKSVPLIPYDPATAKQLVAKSGYSGTKIQILVPAGDAPRLQIAEELQQFWTAVGINSAIQQLDIGAAWNKVVAGDYDVEVNMITSDINDVDELATFEGDYWSAGGSHAFYSWYQNKQVTNLLAKARKTSDPQQRALYYSQIQKTVYWDGYSVPFNFTPAVTAYQHYVHNFRTVGEGWWWLDQVWMNK